MALSIARAPCVSRGNSSFSAIFRSGRKSMEMDGHDPYDQWDKYEQMGFYSDFTRERERGSDLMRY